MLDKDPNEPSLLLEWLKQIMPYAITVFLSMWGGIVNHITLLRKTKSEFKLRELLFDLIASTFAGLITFYSCRSAGISETTSAVLIAISGHMGTRAIAGFESLYMRLMGIKRQDKRGTNEIDI